MLKKTFKIIALLNISALYCFIISLYSSRAFVYTSDFSQFNEAESKYYKSALLSDLLCHIVQAEVSATALHNTPSPSSKNPFSGFLYCFKTTAKLFPDNLSRYSFCSQNHLVRLQQANLIFPFHYFW